MPESNCLHIQDSASGPIRVVEISWPLARIGRASFCEIRLGGDDIAAEVCRLQRRGGKWQIEPLVPNTIEIDGKTINGSCLLAYDTPIQIGGYQLTLRANKSAAPWWGSQEGSSRGSRSSEESVQAPVIRDAVTKKIDPKTKRKASKRYTIDSARIPSLAAEDSAVRHDAATTDSNAKNSLLSDQKRWENRWRAAGEKLRAHPSMAPKVPRPEPSLNHPAVNPAAITPDHPVSRHDVPRPSPIPPIPLKDPTPPPRAPAARSTSTTVDRPTLAEWSQPDRIEPATELVEPSIVKSTIETGTEPDSPPIVEATAIVEEPTPSGTENESQPEAPAAEVVALALTDEPTIHEIEAPSEDELPTLVSAEETISETEPRKVAESTPLSSIDDRIQSWDPSLFARQFEVPPPQAEEPVAQAEFKTEASDFAETDSGVDQVAEDPTRHSEEWRSLEEPALLSEESPASSSSVLAVPESLDVTESNDRETSPAPEAARELEPAPPEIGNADRGDWLNTGTEWVAPADCLESVTASFEARNCADLRIGFVASTEDPPVEPAQPRQIAPAVAPEPKRPQREVNRSSPRVELTSPTQPKERSRVPVPPPRQLSGTSKLDAADPWPSVEDILASHGGRGASDFDQAKQTVRRAAEERRKALDIPLTSPTIAREPECWEFPLWLGWPPLAFATLLVVMVAGALSWSWSVESRGAAIVSHRLLGMEATELRGRPLPLPEGINAPQPVWWRSSARHLTNWAVYLGRSPEAREHSEEIRDLLESAVKASPIYAPARLALARLDDLGPAGNGTPSLRNLVLSRDSISLAWKARRYLKAGNKELALAHYRRAIELASNAEIAHDLIPPFENDPQDQRYLLPGEEPVSEIVQELAAEPNLEFSEWSSILPRGSIAPLAAARILRDRNRLDAEACLDMLVKDETQGGDKSTEREGSVVETERERAIHLAARAEAFAARGKWKEAEQNYQEAIERIDHSTVCRSWWYNLANIENRLKDETQRQKAIKNAVASMATPDEIARRASDLNGPRDRGVDSISQIRGATNPRAN